MTPDHKRALMRERNDSGRYVETVGPTDVLATFDAVDGPVITSTDVAEQLDCTTEAARQKLKQLVEDDILARRRTGRTFVYWIVDGHEPKETQPRVENGGDNGRRGDE